jgi:hypothetical protein
MWVGLVVQGIALLVTLLTAHYRSNIKIFNRIGGVETKLDTFRQLLGERLKNRDEKFATLEAALAQAREAREKLWKEVRGVQDRLKVLEVRADQ